MRLKAELLGMVLILLVTGRTVVAQENDTGEPPADITQCCDCAEETPCETACGIAESLLPSCERLKPWTLPQPCFLESLGIQVHGWLQQGITFNSRKPVDKFNGPVATNDRDREWQMNQFWIFLERPVDTSDGDWDFGGRIDMLYGTDYRFGMNTGLEDDINGFDQSYGIVIPQMYLELAAGDLSIKVGHFAAILDYEMIPAPANPFYSHSYSYGYTVPQLVTGVMADYKVTEQLSVQAALHRGWMQFEDTNDDLDFMAGFKWASCDKKTSVAFAFSVGAQDPHFIANGVPLGDINGIPGDQDRFVYSLVAQHQVTEKLKYVLVHNLGTEQGGALNTFGDDAEWYGINQYLLYQVNPKWSFNMRFEWLRDDDGARIAGPGNIPTVRAWDGVGYAGSFYELTIGANWRPLPTLVVRPEVRWDWYNGEDGLRPTDLRPFDAGGADSQCTVACDAIIMF